MRASRGRSSLYESTSTSSAVAGPREETRASHGSSSSSSSAAAARSLPGSVGSRSRGGAEDPTTPDANELERATREVREACAAVAATCAARAMTQSYKSRNYSSHSSYSSSSGSSFAGSSIRDDPRAPYRRDLAAVESDVIAAVARLRNGHRNGRGSDASRRAPVRHPTDGVEDPSPSNADRTVGHDTCRHPNTTRQRHRHASIARVGTLPTSARRAAAAELVRKAMRRYEAGARRDSASPGFGSREDPGGDDGGRGGASKSRDERGGGGDRVGARPGAPRRVTPVQF